jgi:osmotically-inducible protein OsmY
MNRRYPETNPNGGRERGQFTDDGFGDERLSARAARSAAPREEETSRWTSEGGSQTYYRRDEPPRGAQYGSQPHGQYGGGYGQYDADLSRTQHNYGQYGSSSVGGYGPQGGGGYGQGFGGASGFGGQYGSQAGHGGTPYGASPSQGGPYGPQSSYEAPWRGGSQFGMQQGYGGGGQYGSPLGSSLHSPQGGAGDVRGQYGAQPGYGSQQYGSPYGAQQPYASQYGQQYGGGGTQDYSQHYGHATQAYQQQYGTPSVQSSGGAQYGSPAYGPVQDRGASGYGYQYSGGAGYGAGSQYGASGGYGQGSQAEGRNRGRGPKNYTRSSERLREDVCERLSDDPYIDASEIEVTVAENGRIVVEGSVEERWMKHRIEDLIDAAPGVQQIENRLTIASSRGSSPYGAQSPRSASTASATTAASGSSPATSASGATSPSSEATKRH